VAKRAWTLACGRLKSSFLVTFFVTNPQAGRLLLQVHLRGDEVMRDELTGILTRKLESLPPRLFFKRPKVMYLVRLFDS
jgi:hypothetical protein